VSTPAEGLKAQLRNIEQRYGRPIDDWTALIAEAGASRHADIIAMLKVSGIAE
jgi:hypothetical protein